MIRVAYTRTGKQLHAMEVGTRRTLCGRRGFVHPDYVEAPALLVLRLNLGCLRCQKAVNER